MKSLALSYSEVEEANCPKVSHDVVSLNTTPPTLFNHTAGNKFLHFFYNCSLFPPSLPHIACLVYGAKKSYVFVEGKVPEFDWHRYCESTKTVLVIDEAASDRDLVQGFGKALQDGFKLTWQQPHGDCQLCEASGGFCGYANGSSKNLFCICSDGRHSIDCRDKGIVLVQSEPDYVVIGAVIFGGFTIAATMVYLMKKKRVGSYKPMCKYTYTYDEHSFHKRGDEAGNTTNDLLVGIWDILKYQAKWLTDKIGSSSTHVEALSKEVTESLKGIKDIKEDLQKQKQDLNNIIKLAISESLKGSALPHQEGLDTKGQDFVRGVVTQASREIGDQNREILEKLNVFKEQIEKVINDQNLDDKFGHTEKVIRECLADVENKLAKLQRLGRDILEEVVSNSSAKPDIEKLVLENNKILKRFEDGNLGNSKNDIFNLIKGIKIPGLEQLVKKEDLSEGDKKIDSKTLLRRIDLKQDQILAKLEEKKEKVVNHDIKEIEKIVNNSKREIEGILMEMSKKIERASVDESIAEELAKAKVYLNKSTNRVIHVIGSCSDPQITGGIN
ncbi:hypothetical protein Tsubulata_045163 [Turnera subulata]|uniref:Wall-associated receptor kinase C-terminal domain-containing protein n=1 Tax=Turnera subulata TaxID=218843 RepID=A0A9Q0JGQ8_9ROSI|nr:hypothetical protein Tsubulata_045163 [Turnera subulata]